MKTLPAQHLLYTRLEADYAPAGTSGLQTAWQSPDLSKTDAALIVSRISSSPLAGASDDVQLQYFLLPNGNAVLVRQIPVADRQIIDTLRSSFLSHAVILDPDSFEQLECNPFAVLCGYPEFVSTPRQLLERFLRPQQPVATQITLATVQTPPGADVAEHIRKQIVRWALTADQLTSSRATLVLPGKNAEAVQALQIAFHVVTSPALRRCMTFRTPNGQCVPDRGCYWAAGDLPFAGTGFLRLQNDWSVPQYSPPGSHQQSPWHHTWQQRFGAQLDSSQLQLQGEKIRQLVSSFNRQSPSPPQADPDAVAAADFIQLFPEELITRITECFVPGVPARCRRAAAELLLKSAAPEIVLRTACSQQPLDAAHAARLCCQQLLNPSDAPGTFSFGFFDWWFLLRTSQKAGATLHATCTLMLGFPEWLRPLLRPAAQRSLDLLEPDDFRQLLPLIPRFVRAHHCCTSKHLTALLEQLPFERLSDSDFVRLLRAAGRWTSNLQKSEKLQQRIAQLPSYRLLWIQWLASRGRVAPIVRDIAVHALEERISLSSLSEFPRNHF